MPPAARITDDHACPKVEPGPVPHVGGPIVTGCPTVIIGFQPAARIGDSARCVPAIDEVTAGSPNVIIGNRPAARLGDAMRHGGRIVTGCPTVNLGSTPEVDALLAAAKAGIPFLDCATCRMGGEP